MTITTLDGVLAGMKPPYYFTKAVGGTMVAGRAHSFMGIAGAPGAFTPPANVAITSSSIANPTLITSATHGLTSGDQISISGHTGSTPALDGVHTVTVVNATTFNIPVNVTVGGTGGVLAVMPGTAGSRTAGLTGQVLTTLAGQLPFTNPTAGLNCHLARFQANATLAGVLLLCDRLWHNGGIHPTITTEQLFTSSAQIPARDNNGAITGDGISIGVECYTALGNGTPTLTVKYTNSAGVAGKTGTNLMATANTPTLGDFYEIGLAAGDTGVQKAQSLTLSGTYTSGAMGVVLYRVIAALELSGAYVPNAIDALTSGFPRLYDNSVPFFIFKPNTTTTSNISGHIAFTWG